MDSARSPKSIEIWRIRLWMEPKSHPPPAIVAASDPDLGATPEPPGERRIHRKDGQAHRNHPETDDRQETDEPHGNEGEAHGDTKGPISRQSQRPPQELHPRHAHPFEMPAFPAEIGPGQIGRHPRLFKARSEHHGKTLPRRREKPFSTIPLAPKFPPLPVFSRHDRIFLAEGALQTGTALLYAPPPKLFRDSSVGRAGDC